jgi:flavin-dependent thymidylate synthase
MKVVLAGFNIDKSLIEKIPDTQAATPETISAAYARISRDPSDVTFLRQQALEKVALARRSNQAIVFGMSHHSVAEHAYFNFDILWISRLALEELESRRIGAAYTEKSQRYITLKGDYVIPTEFSAADQIKFKELISRQNDFYKKHLSHLIRYQYDQNPDLKAQAEKAAKNGVSVKMNKARNLVEGWAKEDARYALSLATEAQLGLSLNARTLEHLIRTMRYSDLTECRQISDLLFAATRDVAPSLIILSDPEEFRKKFGYELKDDNYKLSRKHLRSYIENLISEIDISHNDPKTEIKKADNVSLILETGTDINICAAIIHHNSSLSLQKSYQIATRIINENASGFFAEVLKFISEYDAVPREFEFCGDFKFELIISASNFAQLKRHRLMTILPQDYDVSLGITIPPSISAIGAEKELLAVCQDSEQLYGEFRKYGRAADYCLTNAHRRRVLVGINPRELYHISRLREDEHAQWDIKETSRKMLKLAKETAPASLIFSGGKDYFSKIKNT